MESNELCIGFQGGLKAVVWTDTWQVAIMFCSVFSFAIVGTVSAGGFGNVFSKAREGNRLVFWEYVFFYHTYFDS